MKRGRTNIIAAYVNKKIIAPGSFTTNCTADVFNFWVKECLINELIPGQVVVMDNASIHKTQETKKLIESVNCRVIFLPPYSPEFNPIEKFWARLKKWIKSNIGNLKNVKACLEEFFKPT